MGSAKTGALQGDDASAAAVMNALRGVSAGGGPGGPVDKALGLPDAPVLPDAPTLPNQPIPQYQQPKLDPMFALLMGQSQQADIAELMKRAKDDQGLILARYGTRLAQAGTGAGSPLLTR